MSELLDIDTEPESGGRGPSLRDYWEIILKRLWLSIGVFAIIAGAGFYVLSQQPPVYRAVAQVIIETDSPQILGDVAPVVDPAGGNYWSMREYMSTQYRILASRSIADGVAARTNLVDDLVFLELDDVESSDELLDALSRVDVGAAVQAAMSVEPVSDSQLVNLVAVSRSAEASAAIVNTAAGVYVERNLERQVESIDNAARWLTQQHDSMRDALESSEEALVDFRVENGILAVRLEDNVSLLSEMQTLSDQLAQARLEADRLRTTVQQIERELASGDLATASIEGIVESPLIQALKQQLVDIEVQRIDLSSQYLDGHPSMVALSAQQELLAERLNEEVQTVMESYRNRLETAESLEQRLATRLAATESAVQELGGHEVAWNALVREVDANRELYDMIERRLKEVEIIPNAQHNNVQIIETAQVPRAPYQPNRLASFAAVAAIALLLALAAPLGLEALDGTVRSKELLERRFGLTFLGLIPSIRPSRQARRTSRGPARGQKVSADLYAWEYPKSTIAESCRSIRTNLMFMSTEHPLDRLLITSAGPRDGKTTTTTNIGAVMAQSGARVLLIDTDMRRPRLHEALGLEARGGLSSLLLGEADYDEVIVETRVPNLHVLPSGPIPPNPTELMHTERFQQVLRDLDERYDRLIFDSPPVSPVTDATILSSFVDGVMLVVKAGRTQKALLGRSIDQLRKVNANIVGVVLNDVDVTRRNAAYYYGYYYGYYRKQSDGYYGMDDEADA